MGTKCQYVGAPAEGVYSTLKDKKTKVVDTIHLYFMYKAALLWVGTTQS